MSMLPLISLDMGENWIWWASLRNMDTGYSLQMP